MQGVLVFVVVRPLLALIQVFCMWGGVWGEDEFTFERGWLWCMLINNVTQVQPPTPLRMTRHTARTCPNDKLLR